MKRFFILIVFSALSLSLKGQSIIDADSAFGKYYAVSSSGLIYSSTSGTNWSVFDFNSYYSGFYEPCSFIGVAIGIDRVAVLGVESSGRAVLYISTKGAVWANRDLKYKDDSGVFTYIDAAPLAISYDDFNDEFLVLFEGSMMMTIPSCSHCNKLLVIEP